MLLRTLILSLLVFGYACRPPAPPPAGMVYFAGGSATLGAADGLPNEQPVFTTQVEDFYLDAHPVTVAQFRAFVQATGYRTEAETFGDAGVFNVDKLQQLVQEAGYEPATMEKLSYQGMYDLQTRGWELVPGAYWEYPLGPDHPAAPDSHPVTQVSWNDATAYAQWAGETPTDRSGVGICRPQWKQRYAAVQLGQRTGPRRRVQGQRVGGQLPAGEQ